MAGDTLWSIAAANNLTTHSLAVYNGLSENADVALGTTVNVPTVDEASAALNGGGGQASSSNGPSSSSSSSSGDGGSYVVQGGDTLSQIAERAGISTGDLAATNGVDPNGVLLAGTALQLSGGGGSGDSSSSGSSDSAGSGGASSSSSSDLQATSEQVSSDEIIQLAEEHGVPGSLAAAIAWQESGFDNSVISSAGARGVMQIIPDTWDFVQNGLASGSLSPSSARDNVHAGVMFLAYLLDQTGGDPELTAAAYYQGLASVESQGMLPETQRYVANVTALRSRFGGP